MNIKVHRLLFSPVPLLFSSVPEGPSTFLNFRKAFTVYEGSFFPLANSPEDESHGLASAVAVSDAPTDTEPLVCCAATKCSKIVGEIKRIGTKAI
ncbi:hypothetical protein L1987_00590 [Smallanthus sonchifolius]|uniref:Uncharacterized protein n=1 Tax=Smallanthus sonchifolius TaxID=185202 RepID=A0ACB9K2R9_9ASTR|nr:hypothetical protein L1987_00590 [Smallanthus sonchifolius]